LGDDFFTSFDRFTSGMSATAAKPLTSYRKHWAQRFGTAPFLPMSRAEMDTLGWDECDIVLVTGDAYIDHPSFGMALVGRLLEAQGFRVGIISQPDWHSPADFKRLGQPRLFFGITAGNMDSMVNRYTADRKIRSDDAYTPNAEPNRRPDRAVVVYAQRAREAFPAANIVIGSIEASLRRIAHYDYWSDKVRHSVLPDSKADLLLFGNAERALVELSHRLAKGEAIEAIRDLRGTAFMAPRGWKPTAEWAEVDSTVLDTPGAIQPHPDPYAMEADKQAAKVGAGATAIVRVVSRAERLAQHRAARAHTVVRLPSCEQVRDDPVLYAHASRVFHLESNPGNARALVQGHGARDVWLNPPPIPLTTEEMDHVFGLPYARAPHPSYGDAKIPAWEMIRFSINIMRGCFGGCTFCSITEHEGRIIQSRSENSILHEIEQIRDKTPGFTGVISDLGGPTANMYRMACKESEDRELLPPPVLRLPGHLRKPEHRPRAADLAVPQGARAARHQEDPGRFGPALRPRGALARVREGTGDAPRRRLPQDRAGTHPGRPAVEDDEAGHGRLRALQADVRQVLEGSRQGTVPDPLLHRRPPRHHRRGHAGTGAVAQAQRLPPRPGADLPADAAGAGHRDVAHREEPAAQGDGGFRSRRRRARRQATQAAQGLPALPRSGKLARFALRPEIHGPHRPDRPRQAPPDPGLATGGHRNFIRARPESPCRQAPAKVMQSGIPWWDGADNTAKHACRAGETRQSRAGTPPSGRAAASAVAPQGRLTEDSGQSDLGVCSR
jgi:uncharacterized radical SAM protein YgiQ